jgi:beta-glucosidase
VRVTTVHGQPTVTATVRVTNTGKRAGADVAQLYIGQPPIAGNPPRQLATFQRVTLAPGRSRTLTFTLRDQPLAYYDPAASSWRIAAGAYRIWMGDASTAARLPARASFHLASTTVPPATAH